MSPVLRLTPRLALALVALAACNGDDSTSRGDTAATASATDASASTTSTSASTSDGSSSGDASTSTTGGGGSASSGTSGDTSSSSSGGSTGSTTGTTGSTGGTSDTSGTTGTTGVVPPEPIPVHEIPGLKSITFWERSGGNAPTPYTFEVLGPELTAALPDPLTDQSHDIKGVTTEFYDVYYSDIDGVFDLNGSYLTIAGAFGHTLPAGGGLNLAEIALNYENNDVEYGSYVASFVALGDNAAPDSAPKSIDGDLQTHTTMGNNVDEPGKRLRVTLGFESSLMPQ